MVGKETENVGPHASLSQSLVGFRTTIRFFVPDMYGQGHLGAEPDSSVLRQGHLRFAVRIALLDGEAFL